MEKAKATTEKKVPAKKAAAKTATAKPRVPAAKKKVEKETVVIDQPIAEVVAPEPKVTFEKPTLAEGKYIFATGRRKTAVATVRMFSGKGERNVNRKNFNTYFSHSLLQNAALKALQLTGLDGDFYFTATIHGGGIHSQAEALRHGLAKAIASMDPELHKVLKKNGLLTRDDRKKERKKPGLRRARRAPQWAKR